MIGHRRLVTTAPLPGRQATPSERSRTKTTPLAVGVVGWNYFYRLYFKVRLISFNYSSISSAINVVNLCQHISVVTSYEWRQLYWISKIWWRSSTMLIMIYLIPVAISKCTNYGHRLTDEIFRNANLSAYIHDSRSILQTNISLKVPHENNIIS